MKLRLLIIVVFATIMLYSITPLSAQGEQLACDLPTLQKAIDVNIDALGKLNDGKETDVKKISDTLQKMANTANIMRAACDGLVFSGSGQKLLGPIEIPAGTYRATMTTPSDGYVGAEITVTDGACGSGSASDMGTLLFNSAGGDAKDGIESLFTSTGCTLLIQLTVDESKWDIKFERLSTG